MTNFRKQSVNLSRHFRNFVVPGPTWSSRARIPEAFLVPVPGEVLFAETPLQMCCFHLSTVDASYHDKLLWNQETSGILRVPGAILVPDPEKVLFRRPETNEVDLEVLKPHRLVKMQTLQEQLTSLHLATFSFYPLEVHSQDNLHYPHFKTPPKKCTKLWFWMELMAF